MPLRLRGRVTRQAGRLCCQRRCPPRLLLRCRLCCEKTGVAWERPPGELMGSGYQVRVGERLSPSFSSGLLPESESRVNGVAGDAGFLGFPVSPGLPIVNRVGVAGGTKILRACDCRHGRVGGVANLAGYSGQSVPARVCIITRRMALEAIARFLLLL